MSGADLTRAVAMVAAAGGLEHDVCARVIYGAPWSKSRPQFSRNGHAYVPKADRIAENQTAELLSAILKEPYTGNVATACIFFRPNFQRIDVDNMLKHICDAATGIIWKDDSQCTALLGVAEYDAEHPRTIVAFAPHVSTLTRGSDHTNDCERCGQPFNIIGLSKARKYCSVECASLARSGAWLETPIACAQCGKEFRRTTKTQKMCSPECRAAALRGHRRANSTPLSTCSTCGTTLAHHRGGRCRDCWRENPSNAPVQEALL